MNKPMRTAICALIKVQQTATVFARRDFIEPHCITLHAASPSHIHRSSRDAQFLKASSSPQSASQHGHKSWHRKWRSGSDWAARFAQFKLSALHPCATFLHSGCLTALLYLVTVH